MRIANDTVVTVEYTATLEDGTVIDTTEQCGAITYLHGHEEIFAALERAVEGLEAGAQREIRLSASESYGERRDELVRRIPRAQLPRDIGLVPGDRYTLRSPGGQPLIFRLVAVEGDEIVADFNNRAAGLGLCILAKVLAVRAATAEELRWGGVALSASQPVDVVRTRVPRRRPPPELAVLVVVAAALNLCGLTWGLPNVEEWAVDSITPLGPLFYVRQLLYTGHWWAKYPALHFSILAVLYAPYVAWLVLTGSLDLGAGVAHYPYGLSQPEAMLSVFTIIGRLVGVGMGVGTAVGAYLVARDLGGRVAGLIAGLLFACSPLTIYYAHTANLDIPYMFWGSLALLCLVRVVRGAPRRTYVWLGVLAAAAIATKDQAYALFLLLPIPLWALHVRRDGRRGFVDRRLLAGFTAAVVTYLIAANVLIDVSSWFQHVHYITHEGSIPYRMFPATLDGYFQLGHRTLHWIIASVGMPAALLGAGGLVWALVRRVPGAGVLVFAGVSYLVLFLGPILYVLPRFVLPAVFVLAVFGGLAGAWLWERRWLPARAVVAVVLAHAFAYGVTMDLGLLWDSRYAAEEWMVQHVPPTALVGTDGESAYLPRLPHGVRAVPVTMTADGPVAAAAAVPDYLILSDAHYRRYLRRPAMRPVVEKLLRGELAYQPAAVFQQGGFPATELIPAVNPRIVILRRRDGAANVP